MTKCLDLIRRGVEGQEHRHRIAGEVHQRENDDGHAEEDDGSMCGPSRDVSSHAQASFSYSDTEMPETTMANSGEGRKFSTLLLNP